jgi:hypothetical protein
LELINAEEETRTKILSGLSTEQIEHVASACNRFPVLNIDYELLSTTKEPIKPITSSTENSESDAKLCFTLPPSTSVTLAVRIERIGAVSHFSLSPSTLKNHQIFTFSSFNFFLF